MRSTAAESCWRELLKREPCVYCGRRPDEINAGTGKKYRNGDATIMTIEHIAPKHQRRHLQHRLGWENLAPACWNCNNTRGSMGLLHYLLLRQGHGAIDIRFLRRERSRAKAQTRTQRRRERPELPPLPPLTFTLQESIGAITS